MKLFGLKIFNPTIWTIAAVIFQVSLLFPSQTVGQATQWEQEHERKREERRTVEERRNSMIEKEQGILQKLQEIESELATNQEKLEQYHQDIENHKLKAAELQRELKRLLFEDQKLKKLAIKRIRAIYKLGYNGDQRHRLKMLFGAQNMQDFVEKYTYMDAIAKADQSMLSQIQRQQEEIIQTSAEVKDQIQLMEQALEAVQAELAKLLNQERKRQQLLHSYRTEKGTYNKTLKELEVAVAQLEDRLGIVSDTEITAQAQAINSIRPALRGKLPWPVVGLVVANQTAANDRGLTIQAKKGTPVRCVANGIVASSKSIMGFGNTLLIMHGNGYASLYAHLSDISVSRGDTIQAKQVLGTIGETGSLIGPVLFFQLWKYPESWNKPPEALNTRRWLTRKMN